MCDFGGAVQAKRNTDGADAAVNVELHFAEAIVALGIELAHGRENERANQGETDLAAVRMTGKHEVDQREAWMALEDLDVIRFVDKVEDRSARVGGNGAEGVGCAGAGVVGATQEKPVASPFEGKVAVDQNGGAMGFELAHDPVRPDADVVVAEDGDALGPDLGENFGGNAGSAQGNAARAGAAADEVAGDQDHLRSEPVDGIDNLFQEPGFGEFFHVEIGDLHEAYAGERIGQIDDGKRAMGDLKLMPGVGSGIGGQPNRGAAGTEQKRPAGSVPHGWGVFAFPEDRVLHRVFFLHNQVQYTVHKGPGPFHKWGRSPSGRGSEIPKPERRVRAEAEFATG